MNTVLVQQVQAVFEERYLGIVRDLIAVYTEPVHAIQSAAAPDAIRLLDEELGTLTSVFETTVRKPGTLFDILCELLRTFSPYFDLRGLFSEQLQWAQMLLQYFRDHTASDDDAVDMSLLLVIANMFHRLGEHDDALEIYNFVLSIERHRATHPGFSVTYHNMALLYLSRGDDERGMEACKRSLEIDRHNGNQRGIAVNMLLLSDFLERTGQVQASATLLQEAYTVMEPLNNPVLQATFTGKLAAFAAMYTDSPDRAEALFKETITAWGELRDDEQRAITQFNYAVMLHELGRVDEALALAHESLTVLQAQDHYIAKHIRASLLAWQASEDAPSSVDPSGGTQRRVNWQRTNS